jgi:hypothetical protein
MRHERCVEETNEKGAAHMRTMTYFPFVPLRVLFRVWQVDRAGL